MQNKFLLKQCDYAKDLPVPRYMTTGAAGMDIYASVISNEIIEPGEIKLIPTGIIISIPNGYEAQIRARSGTALRNGITMANGVGTIDSDFRGEIKVLILNQGAEPFLIKRGDRIAQMVINKVELVDFEVVAELDNTSRGEGSFGHTGIN